MNETMKSKLARLLNDGQVRKAVINIKCKTKDGMIYTLLSNEHTLDEAKENGMSFADVVNTCATECLINITETVEKEDGLWVSLEEMVSIKHSEIVRIWAEIGDLYMDGPVIN